MSSITSQSFIGIASIPKLKGKANYEEWRNPTQGFCEMNGYWRHMLGQVPRPSPPSEKELTPETKEAFEVKLMKWLTITDSLRGTINFDSILEQILNVDTQKKSDESRSMKSSSKLNESKKSAGPTLDACPYCNKGGHPKDKCYYKHPERASESFRERFKPRITDLKARNAGTARAAREKDTESTLDLRDCGFMVRGKPLTPAPILAPGGHDKKWYFDNAASYHMSFDINDFDIAHDMRPCVSPQDDITLADGSVILPDGIGKVWFHFEVNKKAERIFLSDVRYCKKLDTKLISLGMLDRKGLTYSAGGGLLTVRK